MTSTRSKRRSGTTSTRKRRRRKSKRRPDPAFTFPIIYVDESASQKLIPEVLRAAGFTVKNRAEVFPDQPDVDDPTWLAHCGQRGWVAITKDKEIRHRANEEAMVRNAKVRLFVITKGGLTGPLQAELIKRAVPAIRRWIKTTEPPFMVRIASDGRTDNVLKGSV